MNKNKGKQSVNDVECCRSEKVFVQTNMRVYQRYSVILLVLALEYVVNVFNL